MSPGLSIFVSVLAVAILSMPVFALTSRGRKDADAERKGSRFLLGVGNFLIHWFMWAIGPVERFLLKLGATPNHMKIHLEKYIVQTIGSFRNFFSAGRPLSGWSRS